MLRAIRRNQWFSFLTTVVFWAVILIMPIYLYQQYLQPMISKFSVTTGVPPRGLSACRLSPKSKS